MYLYDVPTSTGGSLHISRVFLAGLCSLHLLQYLQEERIRESKSNKGSIKEGRRKQVGRVKEGGGGEGK